MAKNYNSNSPEPLRVSHLVINYLIVYISLGSIRCSVLYAMIIIGNSKHSMIPSQQVNKGKLNKSTSKASVDTLNRLNTICWTNSQVTLYFGHLYHYTIISDKNWMKKNKWLNRAQHDMAINSMLTREVEQVYINSVESVFCLTQ